MHERKFYEPIVNSRLIRLQSRYLDGESSARAQLADLRRSIGQAPGSVPEIWQISTLPVSQNVSDEPTREENALHWTLCLYGRHQQSQASPMHVKSDSIRTIGGAMRRLIGPDEAENPGVVRRFKALASADTFNELTSHMSAIIPLLRSKGISLDYVQLFSDLRQFQVPGGAEKVRRRWARDYANTSIVRQVDEGEGA